MITIKMAQIQSKDDPVGDIMRDMSEGKPDPAAAQLVHITPQFAPHKSVLDAIDKATEIGFDMSNRASALKVLSAMADPSIPAAVEDMTDAEYVAAFNFTRTVPPGYFDGTWEQRQREPRQVVEDLAPTPYVTENPNRDPNAPYGSDLNEDINMGNLLLKDDIGTTELGRPILDENGNPQYMVNEAPLPERRPYRMDQLIQDQSPIATLQMAFSKGMPVSTRQEAADSLAKMYRLTPEELATNADYQSILNTTDDLWRAYYLPQIIKTASIAQRISMLQIEAQVFEDVSQFVQLLLQAGFDISDPIRGKGLLQLLPPNGPHRQFVDQLMRMNDEQWSELIIGASNANIPTVERPTLPPLNEGHGPPAKPSAPPSAPGAPPAPQAPSKQAPSEEDHDIREPRNPKEVQVMHDRMSGFYEGYLKQLQELADAGSIRLLKRGEASKVRIKPAAGGKVMEPAKGGMYVRKWASRPGDVPEEGLVVGEVLDVDIPAVFVIKFPSQETDIWAYNEIQVSKHQASKQASVSMSTVAQMMMPSTQPGSAQDAQGNPVLPGDMIQQPDGGGTVVDIKQDGKIVYEDERGQKLMKEPGTQFEVIKPEQPGSGGGQGGVGGPQMI